MLSRRMRSTMNKLLLVTFAASAVLCAFAADKPESSFPGLKNVMDPETYSRAGLDNLSPEQRAALDAFIRDYVAGKQKEAASVAAAQAVDRAVKERKVEAPSVIESRIVGVYKGYGPRTVFRLENGQTWKPADPDDMPHAAIANPAVVIYKDFFGYKMFVEGAPSLRVKRVN
jgi:hypothetical protein